MLNGGNDENQKGARMNIESIEIVNLLGAGKSFKIDFNLKTKMTIIHGPNGCGKTTILKIINYLFNFNFFGLSLINFDSIKIVFDDKQYINIKQTKSAKQNQDSHKDPHEFNPNKRQFIPPEFVATIITISDPNISNDITYDSTDDTSKLNEIISRHLINDEILILNQYIGCFIDHPLVRSFIKKREYKTPNECLLNRIRVDFIETQRLINEDTELDGFRSFWPMQSRQPRAFRPQSVTTNSSMTVNGQELKALLISRMRAYANEAQKIDQAFTSSYFKIKNSQKNKNLSSETTKDEIRERLEKIEKHQIQLAELGIIDESALTNIPLEPNEGLSDEDLTVLTIYATGMEKKLENFSALLEKSKLFLGAINKLFTDKVATLSYSDGISIKLKGKTGRNIPLNSLSSGEQHLLVLFYELSFAFENKTSQLFIIDEPEISLHASWQRVFLDLLVKTTSENCHFLIATHSPLIVGGRKGCLVNLGEEEDDDDENEGVSE